MAPSRRPRTAVRAAYDWLHKTRGIPLGTSELAQSAVVFAPHPDDETLGCGGTIARKSQEGAEIKIVFMTDGRGSHRDLMPGDDLARLREQEARSACAALGVDAEHVAWLGIPNGELVTRAYEAYCAVGNILAEFQPTQVFVPYRHEPPPEHRATRKIVLRALASISGTWTVYEYPIWFWNTWPWVPIRPRPYRRIPAQIIDAVLAAFRIATHLRYGVNLAASHSAKRLALYQHRSQMTRLLDTSDWHTLGDVAGGEFLAVLSRGQECFYRYEYLGLVNDETAARRTPRLPNFRWYGSPEERRRVE